MISVAIPTSSMKNGEYLFRRCLDSLWGQTYQNFEIVVTDNSDDATIENLCAFYKTGIRYFRNPRKGMAQNTNEAIKKSKGELIKILYMDDFLAHDKALQRIMSSFEDEWLVTSCTHIKDGYNFTQNDHHPYYSPDIHTGNNTIGSPSVLTIKNNHPLLFDENMTWLLDCDFYKRMYAKFGEPTILNDINVVLGLHQGQMTNILSDEYKLSEFNYMMAKYV